MTVIVAVAVVVEFWAITIVTKSQSHTLPYPCKGMNIFERNLALCGISNMCEHVCIKRKGRTRERGRIGIRVSEQVR